MAIAVESTDGIDTDLHHNAINVLLAIYDAEDETATTTDIGSVTGLTSANISGGHAQTLERRGLIERAGSVESNAPNDTNVYQITHLGRKESQRLLKQTDAEIPMGDGEKLALLHLLKDHADDIKKVGQERDQRDYVTKDELREFQEEIENVRETIESLEGTIEDHGGTIEDHEKALRASYERVKELRKAVFGDE